MIGLVFTYALTIMDMVGFAYLIAISRGEAHRAALIFGCAGLLLTGSARVTLAAGLWKV